MLSETNMFEGFETHSPRRASKVDSGLHNWEHLTFGDLPLNVPAKGIKHMSDSYKYIGRIYLHGSTNKMESFAI